MFLKRYCALAFQRCLQLALQSVFEGGKAVLSISELPASFGSRKGGTPWPAAFGAHKARPVPGTAQANAEAEKDEVPFFFRRLRPRCRVGCCTHRKKSRKKTKIRVLCQRALEFIGVGRREPAHGMQISCGGQGGSLADLSSVCIYVCDGAPPKKSRFSENRVFVFVISES